MLSPPAIEPTKYDVYPFISPAENLRDAAKDKTVLVTGGGIGIGRSIAKTFAMASAKAVIVCGRRTIPLEESKTEIQTVAPGCDVDVVSLDVTDEKNVQDVFAKFKKRNILIDVLVNNAGSGRSDTPVRDSDLNVWWGDFELNVKGKFLMSREYLQSLNGNPGRIINLTTSVSNLLFPGFSGYSASTVGVNRLTEYLDHEGAPVGVRCIAFHPGAVLGTQMEDYVPQWVRDVLHNRQNQSPELPGATCLYLSTPRADYLGGRVVWAPWDMEQLENMKEKIEKEDLFKDRIVMG